MTPNEPAVTYAMVASGPPVRPRDVERRDQALEVVAMWRETVLDVAHLAPHPNAVVLTAEALALGGLHPPYAMLATAHPIPLHPDPTETTTVERGGITFVVRRTLAGKRVGVGLSPWLAGLDADTPLYVGGALVLAGIFLAMFWLLPPSDQHLALEVITTESRIAAYLSAPAPTEQWEASFRASEAQPGRDGKRADEDRGQMGDRDAPSVPRRSSLSGPEDNRDLHMANRESERDAAHGAGILGVLRAATGAWREPTSPFGRDAALGDDELASLGAIMADRVGDSFGFGGLGVIGTGRGGGGAGLGTYGVGEFGGIGRGTTCGEVTCSLGTTGLGHGAGTGSLPGDELSTREPSRDVFVPPPIRSDVHVVGSLSPEVIRRTVRRHTNEVRHCYEQALSTEPDLAGRVTVQFIVAPNGAVQSSTVLDARTDLGSGDVSRCVADAVTRWSFPQPDGGGVVNVTYPFVFSAS